MANNQTNEPDQEGPSFADVARMKAIDTAAAIKQCKAVSDNPDQCEGKFNTNNSYGLGYKNLQDKMSRAK